MTQRQRKALGILATVLFLTVYCLIVMAAGAIWIVPLGPIVQLTFYIAAGLAWLPGVMAIIRFMQRP